jgi:4-hydroxy-2-oxoglutarate aldolase
MQKLNLNGILPPVPTPFSSRGDLDLEGLARNVASYNQAGLAGYIALGSNGEAVHLTTDESVQVVRTIKDASAPGRTIVAGVNEFTSRAAIEAIRRAKDLGVDAALVVTPYYYKGAMTQEALLRHFTAVADNSPLPVLLYNVPQNTGVVIESATIASLASHENIIGIKDSAGNMAAIADTIRRTTDDFFVMVGNGGIFYPSLVMGAAGAVLAVACVAPHACVELYDAVRTGEHTQARELQNRLAPLSQVVTAGMGVAGLKAAMEIAGFVGGPPRSPLMDVDGVQMQMIKTVMRDTGLFPAVE